VIRKQLRNRDGTTSLVEIANPPTYKPNENEIGMIYIFLMNCIICISNSNSSIICNVPIIIIITNSFNY